MGSSFHCCILEVEEEHLRLVLPVSVSDRVRVLG